MTIPQLFLAPWNVIIFAWTKLLKAEDAPFNQKTIVQFCLAQHFFFFFLLMLCVLLVWTCPKRTTVWHIVLWSPDILGALRTESDSAAALADTALSPRQTARSLRLMLCATVSRNATVNCACLYIDLLLNIYVIVKRKGGGGGCHGVVNHRYVPTYSRDLFG